MSIFVKEFLGYENERNHRNAALYGDLMKRAYKAKGEVQVFIGHHLSFEFGGDIASENEIPSADCLLFDHDVMGAVFGDEAVSIMVELAKRPCAERDVYLAECLAALPAEGDDECCESDLVA